VIERYVYGICFNKKGRNKEREKNYASLETTPNDYFIEKIVSVDSENDNDRGSNYNNKTTLPTTITQQYVQPQKHQHI
jgi:hypothetical protein